MNSDVHSVALVGATHRLRDHLRRISASWVAKVESRIDRESRRPVIRVVASPDGIAESERFVGAQGGQWEGFILQAAVHSQG